MRTFPLIPTYREIEIAGGDVRFEELAQLIAETESETWVHDAGKETTTPMSGNRWNVMARSDGPSGPGLAVFLTTRPGFAFVSNIVPTTRSELSFDEYNAAVLEYASTFAVPAARTLGLAITVSDETIDIRRDHSQEVASALLAFSRSSNRSTGSSHPLDRERWFAFIALVHRSRLEFPPSDLGVWLELDGWDERIASDLVVEFEYALGLLRYVDGH